MVDTEKRLKHIEIYRQGAAHWQARGNRGREASSRGSLLMNILAIAVRDYSSAAEAADWLSSQNIRQHLTRYLDLSEALISDLQDNEIHASSIGGGYPNLSFSALAWAIEENDIGERFVRTLAHEEILKLTTPFWREYYRAVDSLIAGKTYKPAKLKTRGIETYWQAYLGLVECLTGNGDMSIAKATADRAFQKRNLDKRLKADAYEIEGSASEPARWDFRRDALISYATRAER